MKIIDSALNKLEDIASSAYHVLSSTNRNNRRDLLRVSVYVGLAAFLGGCAAVRLATRGGEKLVESSVIHDDTFGVRVQLLYTNPGWAYTGGRITTIYDLDGDGQLDYVGIESWSLFKGYTMDNGVIRGNGQRAVKGNGLSMSNESPYKWELWYNPHSNAPFPDDLTRTELKTLSGEQLHQYSEMFRRELAREN
jgi:hypothetical protein|tara:strand:- start:68 stop:649 length:582 start_codon:yes stop_codon:yes gene_type:complete